MSFISLHSIYIECYSNWDCIMAVLMSCANDSRYKSEWIGYNVYPQSAINHSINFIVAINVWCMHFFGFFPTLAWLSSLPLHTEKTHTRRIRHIFRDCCWLFAYSCVTFKRNISSSYIFSMHVVCVWVCVCVWLVNITYTRNSITVQNKLDFVFCFA